MIDFEFYDLLQDRDNDEKGSKGVWDIARMLDGKALTHEQAYSILQDYKDEILKRATPNLRAENERLRAQLKKVIDSIEAYNEAINTYFKQLQKSCDACDDSAYSTEKLAWVKKELDYYKIDLRHCPSCGRAL